MAITVQIKRGVKANAPLLAVGEPYFCTDTRQLLKGSSAGNIVVGPFPFYDNAGNLQNGYHAVVGDVTIPVGGTATVTLSGASVFTNASSYRVFVTDNIAKRTLNVVRNSGASFTIAGGGTGDVVSYLCVGN